MDDTYYIRYQQDGVERQKQVWSDEPTDLSNPSIHEVTRSGEGVSVNITYKYTHRYRGGVTKRQTSETMVILPSDAEEIALFRGDSTEVDTPHGSDEDFSDHDVDELHERLLEVGREIETGQQNQLTDDQIKTVIGTLDAFQVHDNWVVQAKRDLITARYKVYDWLGMFLDNDTMYEYESQGQYERRRWMLRQMAEIYLKKQDVDGFVQELRSRDLLAKYRR